MSRCELRWCKSEKPAAICVNENCDDGCWAVNICLECKCALRMSNSSDLPAAAEVEKRLTSWYAYKAHSGPWTKCKSELPVTRAGYRAKTYLVCSDRWQKSGIAKYSKRRGWFDKVGTGSSLLITHWMDIPQLPQR